MTHIKQLHTHAYFTDKHDMDEAARQHVYANWAKLNKTDRAVLERIRLHSVGQCAAKILVSTIAAAIGKSGITVRRSLSKLVRLQIIDRIRTIRPVNVGQGASIFAIRPFVEASDDIPEMISRPIAGKPAATSVTKAKSAGEALLSLTKPLTRHQPTLPAAPVSVYERIQELVKDRKQVREYMQAFKANTAGLLRFSIHADKRELLDVLALRALHITLRGVENGRVHKPVGYFTNTLRNMIDAALFNDMSDVYDTDPDELLAALPY